MSQETSVLWLTKISRLPALGSADGHPTWAPAAGQKNAKWLEMDPKHIEDGNILRGET